MQKKDKQGNYDKNNNNNNDNNIRRRTRNTIDNKNNDLRERNKIGDVVCGGAMAWYRCCTYSISRIHACIRRFRAHNTRKTGIMVAIGRTKGKKKNEEKKNQQNNE